MHSAVKGGNLELIKLLLQNGFEEQLNQPHTSSEDMPIHIAAQEGYLEIVKYLIEEAACDPKVAYIDMDWKTAIMSAVENQKIEVAKYLVSTGVDWTAQQLFWKACSTGNLELTKWLHSIGESRPNPSGSTPVMISLSNRKFEILHWLISIGFRLDEKDEDGKTPFFKMCEEANLENLKYLVSMGCNINEKDDEGKTPFFRMCELGISEIVKYLIEIGCDQTLGTRDFSPIGIATNNGNETVLKYLKPLKKSEFRKTNQESDPNWMKELEILRKKRKSDEIWK